MKSFDQFHFSLIEREQPDLLEERLTREAWLRRKFGEAFTFSHHGNQFYWVPKDVSDEFLVGIVERQKKQVQRTPPDQGADEFDGHIWTGAMVIIDPVNRPDGQKVAFEDNNQVGQAASILSSLVAHLNGFSAHQFALHFKPLFRGDSFWRFADKHGGRLEYVAFRFTVPNMIFSAGGGVKKGLERIGKDTDAQEIEVKLESEDGVKTDSKSVQEGLAYGEEGNARVTAKSLNGDYWSSTQRKMSVKMQSILNFADAKAEEIRRWLRQALDRDEGTGASRHSEPDSRVPPD